MVAIAFDVEVVPPPRSRTAGRSLVEPSLPPLPQLVAPTSTNVAASVLLAHNRIRTPPPGEEATRRVVPQPGRLRRYAQVLKTREGAPGGAPSCVVPGGNGLRSPCPPCRRPASPAPRTSLRACRRRRPRW